jgi:hypothetical protein
MIDRRVPIGVAALALLLLLSTAALAKKGSITVEQYVRVTAEWQGGGDLDEVCARLGVDRQEYGEYMADLQIHDPQGYDELAALASEGQGLLAAGEPFSEDLLARIHTAGDQSAETVGRGAGKAKLVFLFFALLIPSSALGIHVGIARMRQRTHQIQLEHLADPFDGEVGTDVDVLLADRRGLWAAYARLAAYAQLRGSYSGVKYALTLEPPSWTGTNAGSMTLVRGGPNRMLLAVSRGAEHPTAYAIASSRAHRGQGGSGGGGFSSGSSARVSELERMGFRAEPIPGGVLLIRSGFGDVDLEEHSVGDLLGKALQLCDR